MSIKIKQVICLIIILNSTICSSQNKKERFKENVYIYFDSAKGDRKFNENGLITFWLKDDSIVKEKGHRLKFTFKNIQNRIKYKEISKKLISGIDATIKVNNYLAKKPYRPVVAYYYNSYFKHIYIYEKINEDEGILYNVKWEWAIE